MRRGMRKKWTVEREEEEEEEYKNVGNKWYGVEGGVGGRVWM